MAQRHAVESGAQCRARFRARGASRPPRAASGARRQAVGQRQAVGAPARHQAGQQAGGQHGASRRPLRGRRRRQRQRDAVVRLHPGPGASTASATAAAPSSTPSSVTSAPSAASSTSTWRGAGAHGAQHGQLAPAFVQPGQHHGHQPGQADQRHHRRHAPAARARRRRPRPTARRAPRRAAPPSAARPRSRPPQRCTAKTAARFFRPTSAAVTCLGCEVELRAPVRPRCVMPGSGTPATQSRWIASIACRLMCTVRSTGVPVRARMPTTVKGLSACSAPGMPPPPWLSVMLVARAGSPAARPPRRPAPPRTGRRRSPLKARPCASTSGCRSP